MDDLENLFWGVAGAVLSAAIIGAWKLFQDKRNDQVRLSAKLTQPGDLEVMQFIGCASIIVTITCKGNRVAKIRGARIALEGTDLIPQFEKGFGESFGYVPVKGAPPPVLTVDLIPLRKPDCSDGFVLERDDAVKFAMPIRGVPILDKFPEAPSQNVWIAVEHFDESETIVLRGITIQNMIRDLIRVWGNEVQTLNVRMNINLRASSAVPPGNPKLMGKTNPNPIRFLDDGPHTEQETPTNAIEFTFPAYAIVSEDKSRAAMLPHPDGLMLPIFFSVTNAEDLKTQVGNNAVLATFQTPQELVAFVENPPHSSENPLPSFEILVDSVGPEGKQFGIIRRENVIAHLKSLRE